MKLYAVKAKLLLLGHNYYCPNKCGWTGTREDVEKLPSSSRKWRRRCPDCGMFDYMKVRHGHRRTKG